MKEYEYIILGSGIAGLYAALLLQEVGRVLILTKGGIDECNTRHAQGGIAAAISSLDSPELHFKDTIAVGAGLCDPEAVRILTEEAADRIADLVRLGVPFDTVNDEIALTREAAHSVPRILHAGGDATGELIEVTLSNAARLSRRITILEYCLATDILVRDGSVYGVAALDLRSGSEEEFSCRFLILATGGAGRLFKITTNPDTATGDGVALAYRAGAEIVDMEFFQFHPTALCLPGAPAFLISEAMRGEGGILRNTHGERFMPAPDGELAPRDVVSRSILTEMRKTQSDHVFLDATHLPSHFISTRFPSIYRFCMEHGIDITTSLIPVAPAAHYMMGGVRVNEWGETNIRGLFACGEVACTGIHGANRLASNSLLEAIVFGKRVVERTMERAEESTPATEHAAHLMNRNAGAGKAAPFSLTSLQSLMWDRIGIVRNGKEIKEAADTIASWQRSIEQPTDRQSYELNNMLIVGRLMAESALMREESRGAHFRSDFPQSSEEWRRHIVFRKR